MAGERWSGREPLVTLLGVLDEGVKEMFVVHHGFVYQLGGMMFSAEGCMCDTS